MRNLAKCDTTGFAEQFEGYAYLKKGVENLYCIVTRKRGRTINFNRSARKVMVKLLY